MLKTYALLFLFATAMCAASDISARTNSKDTNHNKTELCFEPDEECLNLSTIKHKWVAKLGFVFELGLGQGEFAYLALPIGATEKQFEKVTRIFSGNLKEANTKIMGLVFSCPHCELEHQPAKYKNSVLIFRSYHSPNGAALDAGSLIDIVPN